MSKEMAEAATMDAEALLGTARALVEREAAAVSAVASALDVQLVRTARLCLAAPGKVVTVGVGTSGPIARRLAHLLSTTGTPSLFLHPADGLHGSLGAIADGDVVIAASKGGRSTELNDFLTKARQRGAQVVALTVATDSPLSALADLVVTLPDTPGADPGGIAAMGSSLVAAAWGDALAIVLMQLSGYDWDAVLDSHPSGAVGQLVGAADESPS